jgi:hypothetical protein
MEYGFRLMQLLNAQVEAAFEIMTLSDALIRS